jgi:bacteriocin-like protein
MSEKKNLTEKELAKVTGGAIPKVDSPRSGDAAGRFRNDPGSPENPQGPGLDTTVQPGGGSSNFGQD